MTGMAVVLVETRRFSSVRVTERQWKFLPSIGLQQLAVRCSHKPSVLPEANRLSIRVQVDDSKALGIEIGIQESPVVPSSAVT